MVNIAFIGSGSIAGTHAGALDTTKMTLAAAVDVNIEAARKLAEPHGGRAFGSLDDLFAAMDRGLKIDAVILATPPSARLGVREQTAVRGLHALIEKPLATTVEEAEKIDDLASANPGLVFAVGFCHRFAPAVQQMKELAAGGKVGHLIRLENTFAFHHPPMAEKWFSDPAVSGGGALLDAGCHSVDLFPYVVGDAAAVGAVFYSPWSGRGESGATALVRCVSGVHSGAAGVIVSGWMEGERFDVRLIGDAGTLSYDYMKPEELVFHPVSGESETSAVEPHDLRFARQMVHFTDCCENPKGDRGTMAGTAEGVAAARTIAGAMGMVGV
mgnify:CR=1 FL=1